MLQHDGPAARIVVEPGQRVERDQLIGRADRPGSVNVHAPQAGQVTTITRVDTAWATDVAAVEIETEPLPAGNEHVRAIAAASSRFSVSDLADMADDAGVTDLGKPARAWGDALRQAGAHPISDVIINGIGSEPTITADSRLLAESLDALITVGVWVRDALDARHIWLAMDQADRQQVLRCRSATHRTRVRVIPLANKYPLGALVLLTRAILGRETPYGHSTLSVGVFVVELGVLPALAAAVLHGKPMTDRVVTVTGSPAARPGHYRICVGTAFSDVLQYVGLRRPVARVIDGGPMTGRAVESLETVVTKQTSAIVLHDRDQVRSARPGPCVRCGWCQEDCPVGVDPQALLEIMERGALAEASRLYPQACIECGLCSYVCPAELPLAEAAAHLKRLAPDSRHEV